MKLKMAENSLFAILLRSPWWISIVIAALVGLIAFAALPERFMIFGASGAIPFLVIGFIALARQQGAPSAADVAKTLEILRAMTWREFSVLIEQAFQHDGYTVKRLNGAAADFEIARAGQTALLSGKRWKAASTGIEPLRELQAAAHTRDAQECFYLSLGEMTDNARQFASENKIRVVQGAELAHLLHIPLAQRKPGA